VRMLIRRLLVAGRRLLVAGSAAFVLTVAIASEAGAVKHWQ
jgi:hypothetical protein